MAPGPLQPQHRHSTITTAKTAFGRSIVLAQSGAAMEFLYICKRWVYDLSYRTNRPETLDSSMDLPKKEHCKVRPLM